MITRATGGWSGWATGLAWLMAACLAASTVGAKDVFVSAKGNDESGDGSSGAPFRTITRALRDLERTDASGTTIRVAMGTYDPSAGEVFPLRLRSGVRLSGHGSQLSIIEGSAETPLFTTSEVGDGRIVLEGLALRAAGCGVLVAAPKDHHRTLQLNDVLFERLGVGVDVRLGSASEGSVTRLRANGARFRDCGRGINGQGESRFGLELRDCSFHGGKIGIGLDGATESGQGVHHELSARRCQFERHSIAGLRRVGPDGANRATKPYSFEACVFRGNRIGIELARPAGDTQLLIRRCSFLENELFGLQSTGHLGNPDLVSRIEDSTFRWNGVALHIVNTKVRYAVLRNQIVDNLGNGIF